MASPRIRRLVAAIGVLALVAPSALGLARAQTPGPDEHLIDGSGLAGAATVIWHVNPNFDFWPLYSQTTIDNDRSHGLSGAFWPGFLVDAFFFLYGVQSEGRSAMGISESQWPSPPHADDASSSAFLLSNFAEGCKFLFGPTGLEGCDDFESFLRDPPGVVAHSSSRSGNLEGTGSARASRFAVPGIFAAEQATSATDARFEAGRTVVESTFRARDLRISSDLHISELTAISVAAAGADSEARSELRLAGASFAGQEVVIDDRGVHLADDPVSDALNERLGAEGIEVRLVRGREHADGQTAQAATGGLLIRVSRERSAEAFPTPMRDAAEAACAGAEQSPLNDEITRIGFEQDNPLYGTIPFLPMPRKLEAEQSVPPPFSCPFLNRNLDVAFVLGLTEASARSAPALVAGLDQPVGPIGDGPSRPAPDAGPATFGTEPTPTRAVPPLEVASRDVPTEETLTLATAEGDDRGVAARLEVLYIALMAFVGSLIVGRSVFKGVSAP